MRIFGMLLSLSLSVLAVAQTSLDSIALEIAHYELLFSHSAVVKGRNQAFIEYLNDSSITFNPLPVNAKKLYQSLPASKYYLTWKPTFVEVSSGGDFGLSTGPWEIRNSRLSDIPDLIGHYVSVWEKGTAGWEVIFDHGIVYPSSAARTEKFKYLLPVVTDAILIDKEKAMKNVNNREFQFHHIVITENLHSAYSQYSADNIRLYRNDHFPVVGRKVSLHEITKDKNKYTFQLLNSRISNGGDLAFTYGLAIHGADTSNYFRLWRKEKKWKIAIDMMNAIH